MVHTKGFVDEGKDDFWAVFYMFVLLMFSTFVTVDLECLPVLFEFIADTKVGLLDL